MLLLLVGRAHRSIKFSYSPALSNAENPAFDQIRSCSINAHVNFKAESQNLAVAGSTAIKVCASRIIRLKAVMQLTGLSRSTIYDRMNPKSPRHDPSFLRQFSLGGTSKRATAVGWREAEVLAWIAQCQQDCLEQGVAVEVSNPAIN